MKLILSLFLIFCTTKLFSQDIQLGGTDLNGTDILDWNTLPVSIPAPSPNMLLADSAVITSNLDRDAFYSAAAKIMKASRCTIENETDNHISGLKASAAILDLHFEIIVIYFPKKFRSSTLLNNARIMLYASAAKSEIPTADAKSFEKIKNEIAKTVKSSPRQSRSSPTYTADEQRVVNQLSRRAIPAINFINGANTLQDIADKAKMQKEEAAEICAFLIQKEFVHVVK